MVQDFCNANAFTDQYSIKISTGKNDMLQKIIADISLVVQRLGLHLFNVGALGSILSQEAKIPYVLRPKNQQRNMKQKQYYNKFNKAF